MKSSNEKHLESLIAIDSDIVSKKHINFQEEDIKLNNNLNKNIFTTKNKKEKKKFIFDNNFIEKNFNISKEKYKLINENNDDFNNKIYCEKNIMNKDFLKPNENQSFNFHRTTFKNETFIREKYLQNLNLKKDEIKLFTNIELILNNESDDILKNIFLVNKNGTFSNLIKNNPIIEDLIYFLFYSANQEKNNYLINFLIKNFTEVKMNIEIFRKINISIFNQVSNIIESYDIIDILILNVFNLENKSYLFNELNLLEIIINNIGCDINIFERIFQKLSEKSQISSNKKLNDKTITGYECFLDLFKNDEKENFIFSQILLRNLNTLKTLFCIKLKDNLPKNYFYFNGNNCLKLKNESSKDFKKINIKNGFSLIFWFKQENTN